jgi:hypothetical protein
MNMNPATAQTQIVCPDSANIFDHTSSVSASTTIAKGAPAKNWEFFGRHNDNFCNISGCCTTMNSHGLLLLDAGAIKATFVIIEIFSGSTF